MTIKMPISALLLVSASLVAQPNIRDVRNAAGDLNPGLPGYGIAAGSLISIAGSTSSDVEQATFPLSASLNGVSVKISSGGQQLDALIVSINTSRILAIVPSLTPAGAGQIAVADANGTTTVDVTFVPENFGIFTQKAAQNSVGAAYALNMADAGNSWNSLTQPAMPGQQIAILGSGAGATSQDETNPVVAESLSTGTFQLYIGGQLATVVSTGRSGLGIDALGLPAGLSGIDSIVAIVPAGVSGCRVSVAAVTDNTLTSNFATISVSPDGTTCSDPGYLSADDINALPVSGDYKFGSISISRFTISQAIPGFGSINLNTDSASALFEHIDVNDYRSSAGGSFVSIGSCIVSFTTADGSQLDNTVLPLPLDAGPAINITGPKGTIHLQQSGTLQYASVTASGSDSPLFPSQGGTPFAEAGAFTADNGSGGADVQSFNANLNNPTPFTWTNIDTVPATVDRTQGVLVTWSGGSPNANVIILGTSFGANGVTGGFACQAKGSDGQFQVPPPVTLAIPPSPPSTPSPIPGAAVGGGGLMVLSSSYARFTAPGLDQGVFTSSGGSLKQVSYK